MCCRVQETAEKRHQELLAHDPNANLKDLLLLELLAWFKKEFFRWTDSPACERCGGKTQNVGMVEPNALEKQYWAGRVENYRCSACSAFTRFPRYNHPGKLLDTRCGRCGEWANCFTLCCRAFGFEARYVLDWTDHVWTEVYSEGQKRWLHCDACENSCDKPLTYEAGWKKKLTYIIAFSKDDIQDVTWRYSSRHAEVLARRRECRENWLVNVIVKMRNKRQSNVSAERKKELDDRLIREMAELVTVREAGEGETEGRQSGSMAWRMARGETNVKNRAQTVITPSEAEKQSTTIHIEYSCAKDIYIRKTDNGKQVSW